MSFFRGVFGVLVVGVAIAAAGCSQLPTNGPASGDVRAVQPDSPDLLPYALIKVTPEVERVLSEFAPRLANSGGSIASRGPSPTDIRFGIGDVISVTIFEAAAGGLFIPIEAGVRPGNFITLPNQNVDSAGNVSVPYAGAIRAKGRTPSEVQSAIVDALKNRAIDPQVVVALVEQRTSLISVLGEVNTPVRYPGERRRRARFGRDHARWRSQGPGV